MQEQRTSFAIVDSDTLDTLHRAELMYRGIAEGRLKIYDQECYDWMKPKRGVAQGHAERLNALKEQLKR